VTLLVMWLVYAAFGVTVFSLIFLWAVRAGQFSHQQRARYLPLDGCASSDAEQCSVQGGERSESPHGARE
jgi:nitrogen fixation-related uncharacterized protein